MTNLSELKQKLDELLLEQNGNSVLTVSNWDGVIRLELRSTTEKKIVLGEIKGGEKYFNYTGKTESGE